MTPTYKILLSMTQSGMLGLCASIDQVVPGGMVRMMVMTGDQGNPRTDIWVLMELGGRTGMAYFGYTKLAGLNSIPYEISQAANLYDRCVADPVGNFRSPPFSISEKKPVSEERNWLPSGGMPIQEHPEPPELAMQQEYDPQTQQWGLPPNSGVSDAWSGGPGARQVEGRESLPKPEELTGDPWSEAQKLENVRAVGGSKPVDPWNRVLQVGETVGFITGLTFVVQENRNGVTAGKLAELLEPLWAKATTIENPKTATPSKGIIDGILDKQIAAYLQAKLTPDNLTALLMGLQRKTNELPVSDLGSYLSKLLLESLLPFFQK